MKQIAAVLLVCSGLALFGQSTRGVLVGNVTDPSCSAVSSASVTVTVERPSSGERLDFNRVRQRIRFPSVSWTMVPGTNIALIRFAQFATGSADELLAARCKEARKKRTLPGAGCC